MHFAHEVVMLAQHKCSAFLSCCGSPIGALSCVLPPDCLLLRSVSHGCVDFLMLATRLGMLCSAMRSNFSFMSRAPSGGGVDNSNFQLVYSILFANLSQSLSVRCQIPAWCDALSLALNFSCVSTPL